MLRGWNSLGRKHEIDHRGWIIFHDYTETFIIVICLGNSLCMIRKLFRPSRLHINALGNSTDIHNFPLHAIPLPPTKFSSNFNDTIVINREIIPDVLIGRNAISVVEDFKFFITFKLFLDVFQSTVAR